MPNRLEGYPFWYPLLTWDLVFSKYAVSREHRNWNDRKVYQKCSLRYWSLIFRFILSVHGAALRLWCEPRQQLSLESSRWYQTVFLTKRWTRKWWELYRYAPSFSFLFVLRWFLPGLIRSRTSKEGSSVAICYNSNTSSADKGIAMEIYSSGPSETDAVWFTADFPIGIVLVAPGYLPTFREFIYIFVYLLRH